LIGHQNVRGKSGPKVCTAIVFTRESSYCFQRVLVIAKFCLSVCPSVRHTGGLLKNGASSDHQIFTIGCLEDSSFRNRKAFLKNSKGGYPERGR